MKVLSQRIFLFFLATTVCATAYAQPKLQFDEQSFDFGEIRQGDVATHEFRFVNEGDQPVVISQVKASCGCTTPYWTREAIPPGGEGVIKAAYNSQGRPGTFNKTITVMSNAEPTISRLTIRGVATDRPPTAEELAAAPQVQMATTDLKLGKAELNNPTIFTFEVSNPGKSPLILRGVTAACNCMALDKDYDRMIPPGETEEVSVIYTPRVLGQRLEVFNLQSNSLSTPNVTLKLTAEVVESLSGEGVMGNSRRGF